MSVIIQSFSTKIQRFSESKWFLWYIKLCQTIYMMIKWCIILEDSSIDLKSDEKLTKRKKKYHERLFNQSLSPWHNFGYRLHIAERDTRKEKISLFDSKVMKRCWIRLDDIYFKVFWCLYYLQKKNVIHFHEIYGYGFSFLLKQLKGE